MAFLLGNTAIYLLASFKGNRNLEADLRPLAPVDVELRFSGYDELHHEDGSRTVVSETQSSAFRFSLGQFLAFPSLEEVVSHMLSATRSPDPRILEFWKEKIVAFASLKAQLAFDAGRERIEMVVMIHVYPTAWGSAEEVTTEVLTPSSDEGIGGGGGFGRVPASLASIEKLEKVICNSVGDEFKEHVCVICLEEFDIGMEVTRMPCMHVFHGDCLARWLERSHLCPFCRYEMPTLSRE
ncbi:uncharacterized protein [Elaeis guineensis]|uniref:Uncharacterized protein LOC105049489 n=1 Tax=Elaeis guineensis var. tenera TaxID=51953 RepID=A0A6I9RJ71_ELAGV|nr:uncharacterized protein LOC105049489 [Elaeis guineensis]